MAQHDPDPEGESGPGDADLGDRSSQDTVLGDMGLGEEAFLAGQILIAMPTMPDPRFKRSLIYLCSHSDEGAMGLMINRTADNICMADLFQKLSIPLPEDIGAEPILVGGPVETGRGFVLHSSEYHVDDASMRIDQEFSMTATLEVLHAIARGEGPRERMVALGYAGWGPGQLEMELRQHGWLACAPDHALLFGTDQDAKWNQALAKLGISAALLAGGGSA